MSRVFPPVASLLLALALAAATPAATSASPHEGAPRDAAHLLDADRLPSIGGKAWRAGDAHDGAVGACQKTELETIGAIETVSRTFRAEDGLTAVQVVGRFADAKSAWRAHRVLAAWHEDCAERVSEAAVGPLESVTVRTGRAESYRGSFTTRYAGLGILRNGEYLTVVEVSARPGTYPERWDPARVAVRRVARTF